jgi:hypothetical protein
MADENRLTSGSGLGGCMPDDAGDAPRVGLLGMSFLNRFDMHRQGSALLLRRR